MISTFFKTAICILSLFLPQWVLSQETRLLRQPSLSETHIAFVYAGDVWVARRDGSELLRISSTPAIESNPILSPDGESIAFTSNRSGNNAVYVVPRTGGTPQRITWHPSGAVARGWTQDNSQILYASSRDYAPIPSNRLWLVPREGGNSTLLTHQRGFNGSFSDDENKIVLEQVSRWDGEWRNYKGGQNKPLIILDLNDQSEKLIPNERTTDVQPVWVGATIYFLSDRDGTMNVWAYATESGNLRQITTYQGSDIKWLSGDKDLIFEREGYLFILNPSNGQISKIEIQITADFPWAETQWVKISDKIRFPSLSPNGKRMLVEARGDIFTIPVEHGDSRNLTASSGVADRRPIWSPKGDLIAWFCDDSHQDYVLRLSSQDGMEKPEDIDLGESKMAWEPTWSPDGKYIAFADDDLRVRILNLESKTIKTVDHGGINIERGNMGLKWSPDSRWLAYSKFGLNNFKRIMVWSAEEDKTQAMTNAFADAFSPAWDQDGKHFYFLASTDLALRSGWTNTSSLNARPEYAAYVVNLDSKDPSPFKLRSDEEEPKSEEEAKEEEKKEAKSKKESKKKADKDADEEKEKEKKVSIDFENLERRIIPMPIPVRNYRSIYAGPEGIIFITESVPNERGLSIHKFSLSERKSTPYLKGASGMALSQNGEKLLAKVNAAWKVIDTKGPAEKGKVVKVDLQVKLDRMAEWEQIFHEAWRYEKDYFYDPGLHGRDWDVVYERYAPLLPYVKHRSDLTYLLDQINGELSVGHSFVFGGDFPQVEKSRMGLLGADFNRINGRWQISRIYTTENWNPNLTSPMDKPGIKIKEGYYIVGIDGKELTANDNLYEFLDGTLNRQTVLHINTQPSFEKAWKEIVKPIASEVALRQRAWVEDNRRLVDSLSNGQLAYVWVPNTSSQGLVSFNRYFFAQQDKKGAVIDERYNGGGLLDDYMVDLMTRSLRAAYTNEVPNAPHRVMPSGILGPKVLLINEMAGSGGDYFPWAFRQQKAGPLIGATTWGGLVKSSVHYALIDGGALTAPDNAIFDPVNKQWIAENSGVAPDIAVRQDAKALSEGRDPQLERAVQELLRQIDQEAREIKAPPYPTPAKTKD